MPKPVLRIVAVFIMPCLLLISAQPVVGSTEMRRCVPASSRYFSSQALATRQPFFYRVPWLGHMIVSTFLLLSVASSALAQDTGTVLPDASSLNGPMTVEQLRNELKQGMTLDQLKSILDQLKRDAQAYQEAQQNTIPPTGGLPSPGTITWTPGRHKTNAYDAAADRKDVVEKDVEGILEMLRKPEVFLPWAQKNGLGFLKGTINKIRKNLNPKEKIPAKSSLFKEPFWWSALLAMAAGRSSKKRRFGVSNAVEFWAQAIQETRVGGLLILEAADYPEFLQRTLHQWGLRVVYEPSLLSQIHKSSILHGGSIVFEKIRTVALPPTARTLAFARNTQAGRRAEATLHQLDNADVMDIPKLERKLNRIYVKKSPPQEMRYFRPVLRAVWSRLWNLAPASLAALTTADLITMIMPAIHKGLQIFLKIHIGSPANRGIRPEQWKREVAKDYYRLIGILVDSALETYRDEMFRKSSMGAAISKANRVALSDVEREHEKINEEAQEMRRRGILMAVASGGARNREVTELAIRCGLVWEDPFPEPDNWPDVFGFRRFSRSLTSPKSFKIAA